MKRRLSSSRKKSKFLFLTIKGLLFLNFNWLPKKKFLLISSRRSEAYGKCPVTCVKQSVIFDNSNCTREKRGARLETREKLNVTLYKCKKEREIVTHSLVTFESHAILVYVTTQITGHKRNFAI